jgi:hypothetical protein
VVYKPRVCAPGQRPRAKPELPTEPKRIRVQFDCHCCECGLKIRKFTYALWLGGGRVCCEDCDGQVTTAEELLGPDFETNW